MKLLLRMSVVLVMLAAGLFWFSTTLPGEIKIRQSIKINATPEQIFPYLNNPTDWKNWSAWNKNYDPTVIYMYGGPHRGVGARQSWIGDKTGNWQMVLTQSVAPDSLGYVLTEQGKSVRTIGSFILEEQENGTLVTWQQTTPLEDNPLALYKGVWQKNKTEEELQQGLQNLQTLLATTLNTNASNQ
ncbi:SRPBCC family protein [Pontibacter sp. KCTC 32443]|uniref:SRPBCC family protein n=1 Tax=Pontibacter TaxID=323449 RepID=UPI00164D82EB|nr:MULTISPECIES: SRPBCC family protein [Pontibacter]MBC5773542.1 SRPBCC family protein [Pontibacter sp. KCTC 32443]